MKSPQSALSLARFCAEQWHRFDAGAWHTRAEIDPLAVAKTARYLSMTSWYGHEEKLARISAELFARIDRSGTVDRDSQTAAFSLAELSATTRYLIARRRTHYATARNR